MVVAVMVTALGLGACAQHKEVVTPPPAPMGNKSGTQLIWRFRPRGQVCYGLAFSFSLSTILTKLRQWS